LRCRSYQCRRTARPSRQLGQRQRETDASLPSSFWVPSTVAAGAHSTFDTRNVARGRALTVSLPLAGPKPQPCWRDSWKRMSLTERTLPERFDCKWINDERRLRASGESASSSLQPPVDSRQA
jgi:hypothetical protein